jgi:hypothetical protein
MISLYRMRGIALLLALVATGCDKSPPPAPPEAQVDAASSPALAPVAWPEGTVAIDYPFTLQHIDAGDLDGDGRLDLTLAAHVESRVETFYQQADRGFRGSGPLDNPGFHPNGTLTLVGGDGQRYLVLNAETANALRAYRARAGTAAQPAGETTARAPTESIAVTWPAGWGRTLAVISKAGATVLLYPDYDPALPGASTSVTALPTERAHLRAAGLTAADLRGQGVPSLLVAIPHEGRLAAITPTSPGQVQVDEVWNFGSLSGIETILPIDFNGDGLQDLFLLGQVRQDAVLLLNNGAGGFDLSSFPLDSKPYHPGVRSGALTQDTDGSLLLWAGMEGSLVVWRWGQDRDLPPERLVFNRPGRDPIRFAAADLDGDGHQDLVMGSAVGNLPLTAVYGPLAPIGAWLEALAERRAGAHQARQPAKSTADAAPKGG